jgi:hypothetical protein
MEFKKLLRKMVISTGDSFKLTGLKAMHKLYILMEQPTVVNLKINKKMVMELPRVRTSVITGNGKMINIMGTAIRN